MDVFEFAGLHGCPSRCGVEVFDKGKSRIVVVATELSQNNGTSVTNAWPQLADAIQEEYNLDDREVTWIEHYPERRGLYESFDMVLMFRDSTGHWRMSQEQRVWRNLAWENVQRLIGV